MIYTLTANPAIDYNIACDGLSANTVTRTRDAVYTPNGKGLNVSFTLDHYGVDTTILGFFAGFSGDFIVKGAEALGVPVKPVSRYRVQHGQCRRCHQCCQRAGDV